MMHCRINSPLVTTTVFALFLQIAMVAIPASGALLDTVGVTLLRNTTTNLDGTGIRVAQPEGNAGGSPPVFEVNPAHAGVNQPVSLFTYESSLGSANSYTNSVGSESGHANNVAEFYFGQPRGVATNVAHVDNYDAEHFMNAYVALAQPIPARIVNQSFTASTNEQLALDVSYDNYAARYGVLFVSGVGNGGVVYPPATCYNGIGVAAYGTVNSSVGPTLDNGRCKPDITAPNEGGYLVTSFTTPLVAGSAAVLRQAGLRGDGGADTTGASDLRTLKALLLNGALKPANWTNGPSTPLDARYGAGVLNVFNSYRQLVGGQHAPLTSGTVPKGTAHPPTGATGTIAALSGWDNATLSSSVLSDRVNHYVFNVTNGPGKASATVTATLTWNRAENETAINDLDLFLYDTATSNLIAQSISGVDNVEHIYAKVPPGRYDLQVWKAGGARLDGNVNNNETYALAWELFSMPLSIARSGTNMMLSWPIYPTGFKLETATNQTAPVAWTFVTNSPAVSNGTNYVTLNATRTSQLFRLRRP